MTSVDDDLRSGRRFKYGRWSESIIYIVKQMSISVSNSLLKTFDIQLHNISHKVSLANPIHILTIQPLSIEKWLLILPSIIYLYK